MLSWMQKEDKVFTVIFKNSKKSKTLRGESSITVLSKPNNNHVCCISYTFKGSVSYVTCNLTCNIVCKCMLSVRFQ